MKRKVIIGIVGIVVALALLTPNAPKEDVSRVTGGLYDSDSGGSYYQ